MKGRQPIEDVTLDGGSIRLGQFLKFAGILDTGGEVKEAVADGLVMVNREVERRRGRQLAVGDVVEIGGRRFRVTA